MPRVWAPLPGPDASRESNQRLAQITQYARQLAGSPSVINTRAREQLAEVGLTARDTVLINQIIGFIGFQARVAAIFQAFCRLPVRELPGQEMQRFARAARFQNPQTIWRPAASLVEYPPAHTKVRRQYSSSQCQMMAPVLMRDPSSFALLERILTSTLHTASPLLYFHLSRSSHHVSTAAPPALTNRQPNLARGVALSSRYARKTTTSLVGNLSLR